LSLYKSHPRDHCWTSWSTWQSSESHFKIGSSNGFTILTVKGYVTGRITETARFCKTSTAYETIENDAHAWNLALMMQWRKAHYRQPRASNASFSRYLDNTRTILNIESPLQPQLKIPWSHRLFLLTCRWVLRLTSSPLWSFLRSASLSSRLIGSLVHVLSPPKIMYPQSHIDLTNGLAQSRLSILQTESDWAMSVGEVEVGDEIF
jgi:hypothetical protein